LSTLSYKENRFVKKKILTEEKLNLVKLDLIFRI
jgi:hypothetical protein